ncbi:MAG: hypothetical protein H0T62_11455 [Parachlamydiaceae bacterium]|nr:hypothetical protein [Parachlamydiaceae bacterium]
MNFIYLFLVYLAFLSSNVITADKSIVVESLDSEYQKKLLKKVGEVLPELASYPFYTYPNNGHELVMERFPNEKVLLFGYGSLMNKESASRSMGPDALNSMYPAIAFGVKRMFNYKAKKTEHWGENQDIKEKAMLNVVQTLNMSSIANGVVVEVDLEDFTRLVQRETGYDLVPVLIGAWKNIEEQDPDVEIRVAYTFAAAHELRDHIDYTSTEFYPVRGYLHAVQDATKAYGDVFATMWNATTFLADGTTSINDWDEQTFDGILCTGKR